MNALHILLSVAAIIVFYYFWAFNYWKKRGVKTLKPNLLFGNITGVALRKVPIYRMFQEVYETSKKRGEKFMGFYFLGRPALVVTDHELMKHILTKDFDHFTDRSFYINENDPLTVHIASTRGEQWKKMREKISPAFSPSKMKFMCQTLIKVGDELKSVLDKSADECECVDMKELIGKYMVDAIGTGVFGIECNSLKNSNVEFKEFAECTFGGSFSQNIIFMLSVLCPAVLHFFKIPFNSIKIQNFYLNLVQTTVEHREKNNIVRNDLMHSLIQLRNNIDIENDNILDVGNVSENEKSLKIVDITAQALVFFGAAFETTLSTIALSLYELALNVDIQNTLREEIVSVLKKYDGKISYDAITAMTYLDKCVSEILRKYAVASFSARACSKKYKLPNTDVIVNVGDMVYIPIYEFQQDPEYYPNPEKYDPERFSPENKSMRLNYTFLSFGGGPRNCIGSRLGVLQVKIFLATFLSNYNYSINSKVKLPMSLSRSSLVVTLEHPLYLNIRKI